MHNFFFLTFLFKKSYIFFLFHAHKEKSFSFSFSLRIIFSIEISSFQLYTKHIHYFLSKITSEKFRRLNRADGGIRTRVVRGTSQILYHLGHPDSLIHHPSYPYLSILDSFVRIKIYTACVPPPPTFSKSPQKKKKNRVLIYRNAQYSAVYEVYICITA